MYLGVNTTNTPRPSPLRPVRAKPRFAFVGITDDAGAIVAQNGLDFRDRDALRAFGSISVVCTQMRVQNQRWSKMKDLRNGVLRIGYPTTRPPIPNWGLREHGGKQPKDEFARVVVISVQACARTGSPTTCNPASATTAPSTGAAGDAQVYNVVRVRRFE
jgi:hypothetical protein